MKRKIVKKRSSRAVVLDQQDCDMLNEEEMNNLEECVKMLTEAERQELTKLFSTFDKDSSGFITKDEFKGVMKELNVFRSEKALLRSVENMFLLFDKSKDNKIDEKEFLQMMAYNMKLPLTEEELIESFKTFDTNRDGTVDLPELKKALSSIGDIFLTTEECDDLMGKIDVNNDGNIEIKEFVDFFMHKDLGSVQEEEED